MFCKNCGSEMNDNQAICLKCGVKTGDGNAYCANCGHAVNPEAEVCLNCGVAIKSAKSGILNGKIGDQDKLIIALICLFFGSIGIHNFILGETKKGVVRIILTFCFGIGAIVALIDLIKILTDKYVVDPTKAF